tara:strand:- start:713 stop:1318 length:606 start_codon:yes stop_codon:yes gene_type:complete
MEYKNLKLLFNPSCNKKIKFKKLRGFEVNKCWIFQPLVQAEDFVIYIRDNNIILSDRNGFLDNYNFKNELDKILEDTFRIACDKWLVFPAKIYIIQNDIKVFIYDLYIYNSENYTGIETKKRLELLSTLFKPLYSNLYYNSFNDKIKILKFFNKDFKLHLENLKSNKYFNGIVLRLGDCPLESLEEKKNNIISHLICKYDL